jgi:sulfur carrier protein
MEIKINHQTKSISENSLTVQALLNQEIAPEKQKGIAIAINNQVISKNQWGQHLIQEQDDILIIKATQGG